jgi:hypothetical protein
MSFWENKPVCVKKIQDKTKSKQFTSNLIVSPDTLLKNSSNEIEKSKIQLEYDIILNPDDDCKNYLVKFINKNYEDEKSNLVLQYSKSLLDYFINADSLCIVFYSKGNRLTNKINYDKMIGLIIGKKHKLLIKDDILEFKQYDCIDVDFLCLVKQLRNLHVSSYMINVITKECMLQYDKTVPCAVYTINKRLKVDCFCKKIYYHRPLQIENMLSSEMLDVNGDDTIQQDQKIKLLEKLYNSFSYSKDFLEQINLEYYTNIQPDENIVDLIHDNLLNYNQTNHDIFEYKSKQDIVKILENPIFHKFVIKNHQGYITDFICLYNLDTFNTKTKNTSRNGHFYSMFLKDNSCTYMSYILETISKYCYDNNIFDVLTIMNVLNIKPEEYKLYKLLRGSASLYYYTYNIEIPNINPHKNGLVTI